MKSSAILVINRIHGSIFAGCYKNTSHSEQKTSQVIDSEYSSRERIGQNSDNWEQVSSGVVVVRSRAESTIAVTGKAETAELAARGMASATRPFDARYAVLTHDELWNNRRKI